RRCAAARQRKGVFAPFQEFLRRNRTKMKRLALSMTILGVPWWLWTVRTIHASNDRYIVAQLTNGTPQEPGGANATLVLTVFSDIRNLSYPNHFIQWIQVTLP